MPDTLANLLYHQHALFALEGSPDALLLLFKLHLEDIGQKDEDEDLLKAETGSIYELQELLHGHHSAAAGPC